MNIVSSKEERVQATKVDPERLADKTAEKVVELLGKTPQFEEFATVNCFL